MSLGEHVLEGITTILMVALLINPTLSSLILGLAIELFGLVGEDGPFLTTFFFILTATASQVIPEYLQHEIVYDLYLFSLALMYQLNAEYARGVVIALAVLYINEDSSKVWLYGALEVFWVLRPFVLPSLRYLKKLVGPSIFKSVNTILQATTLRFCWLFRHMKQKAKLFKPTPVSESPPANLPELSFSSIMVTADIPPTVDAGIQEKPTYVDASTQVEELPNPENRKSVEVLPERLPRRWDIILYYSASGNLIKKVWRPRKTPTYDRSIPVKVFLPHPVSARAEGLIEASELPPTELDSEIFPVGSTLPAAAEVPEQIPMAASEPAFADASAPVPATILESLAVGPASSPVSPVISVSDPDPVEPAPTTEQDAESCADDGSVSAVVPGDEPKLEPEAVPSASLYTIIETDSAPVAAVYEPASGHEELATVSNITETDSVPVVVSEPAPQHQEPTTVSVVGSEDVEAPATNVVALAVESAVESVVSSSSWPAPVVAPHDLRTIIEEEEDGDDDDEVLHVPAVGVSEDSVTTTQVASSEDVPLVPVSVVSPTTAVPTIILPPVVESSPLTNDTVMIDSDTTLAPDDEEMGGTEPQSAMPPNETMAKGIQAFEPPMLPGPIAGLASVEWNAPLKSEFSFTVPAAFEAQYPPPSQSLPFVPASKGFSFTAGGPVPLPFFSANPSSMSDSTIPPFPFMSQEMEEEPTNAATIRAIVKDEHMVSDGSPSPGEASVDVNMETGGYDSDDEELNLMEMALEEELMEERSTEARAQALADLQKAREDVAAQIEEEDRAIYAAHGFDIEPESESEISEYDSQEEDNIIPTRHTLPSFVAQPAPESEASEDDPYPDIEFEEVRLDYPSWTPIAERISAPSLAPVTQHAVVDTPMTPAPSMPSPSPAPNSGSPQPPASLPRRNPNDFDSRERASVGRFQDINPNFLLETKRSQDKKIIILPKPEPEPEPSTSFSPDEMVEDAEDESEEEDEPELPPRRKEILHDYYRDGDDGRLHKEPLKPDVIKPVNEKGVAVSMEWMIQGDEKARAWAEAQQILIDEEERRRKEKAALDRQKKKAEKRQAEEEAKEKQAEEDAKKEQETKEQKKAKQEKDLKRLLANLKKPPNIFIPKKKKPPRPPPGGNGGSAAMAN
ncbi:hypothetical protein F5X99DRAFT_411244 [Biscogniauxia marginata]|nr:hypothetical protein F5X99DRAFT_411244 [Biscogniauxia marginata]